MLVRRAEAADAPAIAQIIVPTIRDGSTYALDPDMTDAEALAYWMGPDRETFVAVEDGVVVGTYFIRPNQAGGGRHVANCGYMTASAAAGRGVARLMCEHSLQHARESGFKAMQFNFVVSTNLRALRLWQSLGFEIVGRLPGAFDHPREGLVDALVMYRTLCSSRPPLPLFAEIVLPRAGDAAGGGKGARRNGTWAAFPEERRPRSINR